MDEGQTMMIRKALLCLGPGEIRLASRAAPTIIF